MQTIGERLEEARKRKGISIREAAEATKIRGDYLQKFEGNQFDIGLTGIYVRGFLKSYASYLKLPCERLIHDFEALGHAEAHPRQPSREIYGRMDMSIASADERGEIAAAPAAEPPPQEAPARRPPQALPQVSHPPQVSRGTGLPAMPGINPVLVFKGVLLLVVVLVLFLVFLLVKALVGGGSAAAERAPSPVPSALQAAEPTFSLIALGTVHVRVTSLADDRALFDDTLLRGQTQVVPWPGKVMIRASSPEALNIEVKGKRYGMPYRSGTQSASAEAQLPAP